MMFMLLIILCFTIANSYILHSNYYSRSLHVFNSNINSNSDSNNKDISCEKEGSCRQIRGAFKEGLNQAR
jgi:hypothetical protein